MAVATSGERADAGSYGTAAPSAREPGRTVSAAGGDGGLVEGGSGGIADVHPGGTGDSGTGAPRAGRNLLTDNPALYEARFPDPDRLAGRWAEDCLRRHGAGTRVLDMGCGTGRDAAHLHSVGRAVTGADLSEAMLAHARAHHPGPAYVRADLHGFALRDLGRDDAFDAVVCLDSSLLYCHTNDQLDGFLASCRHALAPGGLLIAEMRNGAYFLGRTDLLDAPSVNAFTWQGTAYRSTTTLTVDRTAQLLRRTRVWTAEDGSPPVEQRSAWRLLFPHELRHFLAAHGFEVLELHDGPGPRTEPPWAAGELPGTATDQDRLHVVARRTH
ncbi:class I SAM-dependent DNA methyltransferase [Streptomyces sp. NPDC054940]